MGKITKQNKIDFANSFMQTNNGLKSLEFAGLPQNYDTLFKLLNDNFVNDYIEKYSELAEIYEGNSKDGHIADLEKLFKSAVATKNFQAVSRLSERIEKLKGWDKTETNGELIVDLKLGGDTTDIRKSIDLEPSDIRENKVLEHFKKEGLL